MLLDSSQATRLWRPDLSSGVGLLVAGRSAAECKIPAAKTESGDNRAQPFTSAREGYGVIGLVFEMTRRWQAVLSARACRPSRAPP